MGKSCRVCLEVKEYTDFYKDAAKKDGVTSDCKACRLGKTKNYYASNKEAYKKVRNKHYLDNKDAYNAKCAKRRANRIKATPIWYRKEHAEILQMYKEASAEGNHVDHIIPLHHELVCGLHTIANLQKLTPSDNLAKSNSFIVG